MDMPASLNAMSKNNLVDHARQVFGTEIAGSKIEMLDALQSLYAAKDGDAEQAAQDAETTMEQVSPESMADSLQKAARAAEIDNGEPQPFEPPDEEILPEDVQGMSLEAAQAVATATQVETVAVNGATFRKWPDSVQWLYNPKTKCRFPATPALLQRLDLFPCKAPKEYRGY